VTLSKLFLLYAKARILSWLTTSTQPVYIITTSLSAVTLAEFRDGRLVKDSVVPDTVPTWGDMGEKS
jgi:hypothetical protein